MEISYKRDMAHNYMVVKPEKEVAQGDYQIPMMTENRLEGLLAFDVKRVDGICYYFYDITSRHSMAQICGKERLREKEIRQIFQGLYLALREVQRYLLEPGSLVLEPEMIYMDVETKQPCFCYLPAYGEELQNSLQVLAQYLMQQVDAMDDRAVLLGYKIYRGTMEENCSMEKLLKETAYEQPESGVYEQPEPTVWEPPRSSIQEQPEPAVWEQPGIAAYERPDLTEKKMAAPMETQGTETRREVMAGDKKLPVKKWRLKILVAVLAAGAATLLGALCAVGYLDVTQLGGIVFLALGLTAYGCSYEKKHRKTEEELVWEREKKAVRRVDRAERKALQGANREENRALQSANREENRALQSTECEMENTGGRMRRETGAQVQEPAETLGATTVLFEGDSSYEPHIALISMNPRERGSVVLLEDSYVVGKLKARCDICINDASISRIHAQIVKEDGTYYLCDLNSTNGTFLNGRRLAVNEKAPIQLTDEISFAGLGYYVGKC